MKECTFCKRKLPFGCFRKINNRKKIPKFLNSYCNSCEKEINKNRSLKEYRKNPEKYKESYRSLYLEWKKRLAGDKCQICGEKRTLDLAHIIPRLSRTRHARKADYNQPDNILGLCPTHHRLFDEDKLNDKEYEKIKDRVEKARKKYAEI